MSDFDFDITECVDGTTVRYGDLILIGAAVLSYAAVAPLMRHASPVGTTDYAEPEPGMTELVRDFIVWCGAKDAEKASVERAKVIRFVQETGWQGRTLDFGSVA